MKFRPLILIIAVLLGGSAAAAGAQEGLPANLSPIVSAKDLVPLVRLGYGRVNDAAWSPDGRTLAVASSVGVWLYDAADLQAAPRLIGDTVSYARVVTFSPDGRLLAAGGSGARVWNAETHELVQSFDAGRGVLSLAFSPDSAHLALSHDFSTTDADAGLWDITTGRETAVLDDGVYADLVFSPDGTHAAGIRLSDCCFSTYLWDTTSGATLFHGDVEVMADDERPVFSPDGEHLVILDRTGSFTVLEAGTQTPITTVALDTELDDWYPVEAAFTPDGRSFVSLSRSGVLRIWDTGAYDSATTFNLNWNIRTARLSPDGTTIAAVDAGGSLRIWDVSTGQLVAQRDNFEVDDRVVAFSPDGTLLASGASDGEVWLWDVASGQPAAVLSGHEGKLLDLDFSPDGTLLASASDDGTARLWDVASHSLARIIARRERPVNTVIFDSEGRLLVADDSGLIHVYDVASGEPVDWFYDTGSGAMTGELKIDGIVDVAYTADRLAVATIGGKVDYWIGNPIGQYPMIDATAGMAHLSIEAVAFDWWDGYSPVYAGNNNVVLGWNEDGVSIIATHNSWIHALAFSPFNQVLASAGCAETDSSPWDGSPYCGGAELRLTQYMSTFPEKNLVSQAQGHTGPIRDMAFNPDGTLLATASDDGTILLWGAPEQ